MTNHILVSHLPTQSTATGLCSGVAMFEFVQPNDEPTYQCTICHELPTGDNKAFGCSKQQHIVCAKCSARVRECPLKCGSTSFVSIDGILGRLIPIIKVGETPLTPFLHGCIGQV